MKLRDVEKVFQARTPVQYLVHGLGWLPDGWHDVTIAAIDTNEQHPRVWLNIGNAGQITLESKKDIRERLRIMEGWTI